MLSYSSGLPDLSLQYVLGIRDSVADFRCVLSAGLCHIRTAAASSSEDLCGGADDIARVCAFSDSGFICHAHQIHLSAVVSQKKDDTAFSELRLQAVAQVPELIRVYIFERGCDEFYTVDILRVAGDITQSALRFLCLQGFILAACCLELILKSADVIREGIRSCLEKVSGVF